VLLSQSLKGFIDRENLAAIGLVKATADARGDAGPLKFLLKAGNLGLERREAGFQRGLRCGCHRRLLSPEG
jgi:hypothetical protein